LARFFRFAAPSSNDRCAHSFRRGNRPGMAASGRGRSIAKQVAIVSVGRKATLHAWPWEGPQFEQKPPFRPERKIAFTALRGSGAPQVEGKERQYLAIFRMARYGILVGRRALAARDKRPHAEGEAEPRVSKHGPARSVARARAGSSFDFRVGPARRELDCGTFGLSH
jgi:hypothetical protein